MIDLTPVDVRKKKGDFRRIMRGYDPALVDDFLDLVADRMEELVRQNLALAERTSGQDQQVSEYRERERALTEALVTAQEMREEIRRQTVKEAEEARQQAEQEMARLRSSTEQEVQELWSRAQQEVQELKGVAERETRELRSTVEREATATRATAEREAEEVRGSARREAEQLLTAARSESEQLRSGVAQSRELEEAALQELRTRHQDFAAKWRAFLERQLAELDGLKASLGPDGEPAAMAGPAAAAAAALPGPAADDFSAPGDDPDALDEQYAAAVEDGDDVGLLPDMEPPEPFSPEPFQPEPSRAGDLAPLDISGLELGVRPPKPEAELELYEGVAEDTAKDGIPGPVGLGRAGGWAAAELKGPELDLVAEPGAEADRFGEATGPRPGGAANTGGGGDEPVEDEEEAEVSMLLRNAEAAGYRVADLEREIDDLLEEKDQPDKAKKGDQDDGWVQSLLDDEK